MRHPEDLAGERGSRPVHRLDRAADRVALLVAVVLREAAARLHAVGAHPVDDDRIPDDVRGAGEGRIDRLPVAGRVGEGFVARVVVPHRRRAGRERRLGRNDGGQRLIVDFDQLGGILRLAQGFRHDEGDRIADIAHPVLRQERLRADESGGAVAPSPRHPGTQRAKPATPQFGAGQHREDARHLDRTPRIERDDPRMGMRRAHDMAARRPRRPDIVDIAAPAGQEAQILLPAHPLPDPLHAHRPGPRHSFRTGDAKSD